MLRRPALLPSTLVLLLMSSPPGGGAGNDPLGSGAAPSSAWRFGELSPFVVIVADGEDGLYAADPMAHQVFRIDPEGGHHLIAGDGTARFGGDGGPAAQAALNRPAGLALDGRGGLLVADQHNGRIRRIDIATSRIETVAGNGKICASCEGLPALETGLASPSALARDREGNLYIAEVGLCRVRRMDARTGTISTVAGSRCEHSRAGDGGPAAEAVLHGMEALAVDDAGYLYVAQPAYERVRRVNLSTGMIETWVGTGKRGFGGDGGPAREAHLHMPMDIAVDPAGNLYVADEGNSRIRRVDARSAVISTLPAYARVPPSGYGPGEMPDDLRPPRRIAVGGSGDLFVFTGRQLWRLPAGRPVLEELGRRRRADPGAGTALAGPPVEPTAVEAGEPGELYVADARNHRLLRVDASSGRLTVIAGGGLRGTHSGELAALEAPMLLPRGLALLGKKSLLVSSADHVYLLDLRRGTLVDVPEKYTRSVRGSRVVYTPRPGLYARPHGLAADRDGRVFIADSAGHRVVCLDPSTGAVQAIAGTGTRGFGGDGGPAVEAILSQPEDVAYDPGGFLYIADTLNHRIRRVSLSSGRIDTVAGDGRGAYGGDGGPPSQASLKLPAGVAVEPGGTLIVADTGNSAIRRIDIAADTIRTIAGTGSPGDSGDGGPSEGAALNGPKSIAVDPDGNIFVADTGNLRVRRIDRVTGRIATLIGP